MTESNIRLFRCVGLVLVMLSGGCDGLLDAGDPTAVVEGDIANPDGAELLRREAIVTLHGAVAVAAFYGGLLADEFFAFPSQSRLQSGSPWVDYAADLRDHGTLEAMWGASSSGSPYGNLQGARLRATHALTWYRRYGLDAQSAQIGELFAVRGYATLLLAEQICPGFALHTVQDDRPAYGPPLTTDQVFGRVLEDLDSAVVYAPDSVPIVHFAQVVRARALLGLGRFAEAAVAAATVPTEFARKAEYRTSAGPTNNLGRLHLFNPTGDNIGVADQAGGVGLDFVSAADPRVPVTRMGTAHDGVTELYAPERSLDLEAPISLTSGIEARLIESEADLRAGGANWLAVLNELRATHIGSVLGALSDPGGEAARVDMLFRERAFWLFGTGHRPGDLRRLITQYGRAAEDVFPTGTHPTGSTYENATSIPFMPVGEEMANTGVSGCTDR